MLCGDVDCLYRRGVLLLLLACTTKPEPVDTAPVTEPAPEDTAPPIDTSPPVDTATDTHDTYQDTAGSPTENCADARDNDGDVWADAADPDCTKGTEEVGFGATGCNDGLDNDLDGEVDGYDDDCDDALDDEGDPGLVAEVPLAAADLILRGNGAASGFGGRVGVLPDIDGDGYPEITATVSNGGAAELRWYSGLPSGTASWDAAAGTVGSAAGDGAVGAILGGDVNGDGVGDLLVGSPDGAGGVYVFLGPVATGARTFDTAEGRITGVGDAAVGSSLAWVPDLSGDGQADLVVGALDGGTYAGTIVPGPLGAGDIDISDPDQIVRFEDAGDAGGGGELTAADFDGDGAADLVVGAPGADDTHADHGKVYVLAGPVPESEIELRFATGTWVGEDAHHAVGKEVVVTGDVNDDGLPDLLVGMSANDSYGSVVDRAYLIYAPVVRGETSVASAQVVFEGDEMFDGVGFPLSVPGDVDGDGRDDVLLSASGSDLSGRDAGLAYLFYGAISPGLYACERARATFIAEAPGGRAGAGLAGGDVNLDGFADLVIAAPFLDLGSVYVMYGEGR